MNPVRAILKTGVTTVTTETPCAYESKLMLDDGREIILDAWYYCSYDLRDGEDFIEFDNYQLPGMETVERGVTRTIRSRALCACVPSYWFNTQIAVTSESYPKGHTSALKITTETGDDVCTALIDALISIAGERYGVIEAFRLDDGMAVILDRNLSQPVEKGTAIFRATWQDMAARDIEAIIQPGGLHLAAPKIDDPKDNEGIPPGSLLSWGELGGLVVRQCRSRTRAFDHAQGVQDEGPPNATRVTFDMLVGMVADPKLCDFRFIKREYPWTNHAS